MEERQREPYLNRMLFESEAEGGISIRCLRGRSKSTAVGLRTKGGYNRRTNNQRGGPMGTGYPDVE